MELELKMQELACCEKTQAIVITHEESLETAIPEYCPDVARIVETVGQVKIREKTLSAGRLTVSGTVKMTILYTSEESAGLRSMTLPVPFSCVTDDPRLQNCRSVCACGRLQLVEARVVSARKLYVRVMPQFEIEGICDSAYELCASAESKPGLHIRRREEELLLLTGVVERTFNFNQEFLPESGQGDPEDLLLDRVHLRVAGCQRMGGKLLIKGEASVAVLYRTENQDLCSHEAVLPFSQILDVPQLPEEGVYQAEAWAEEFDTRLVRTADGIGFGAAMRLGLIIKIYEKKTVSYIDDLYSTKCDTSVKNCVQQVDLAQPLQNWHQEVVQRLEFGQGKPFVHITGVECSSVSMIPEGEHASLQTNLRVKLLYLDESGAPVSAERSMDVAVQLPRMPDRAQAVCAPIVMNLGANSCELRIPVDFFTEQTVRRELKTLASAQWQERCDKEQPALVLRRASGGEDLWDIAKAYQTDPDLIRAANELKEGEALPAGMLLIPKAR